MHNSCDLSTQLKSRDSQMYEPPVNPASGSELVGWSIDVGAFARQIRVPYLYVTM